MGNRKTIRIWQDNWVSRDLYFRILTPPPRHWDIEVMVGGLFWSDTKQWNVQLLNDVFSFEEVDLIRSIPLSVRDVEGRCAWHYE